MDTKEEFIEKLKKEILEMKSIENHHLCEIAKEIYQHYTGKQYEGEVLWSNRLKTSAGNIHYQPKTKKVKIHINTAYVNKFGTLEIIGILKHELAHYYLFERGNMKHRHGEVFKKTLKEIFHSDYLVARWNEAVYQHTYQCGHCGALHRSIRKINRKIYCAKCVKSHQGKFREEFQMIYV